MSNERSNKIKQLDQKILFLKLHHYNQKEVMREFYEAVNLVL